MTTTSNDEANHAKQLMEELISKSLASSASRAEFGAWKDKVLALIRRVYGAQSQQENDFLDRSNYTLWVASNDGQVLQRNFLDMLPRAKGFMEALVGDLEMRFKPAPQSPTATATGVSPKIFVSHGGDSEALQKLKEFLEALGCTPLLAEKEPSEGRLVEPQVKKFQHEADCEIILATAGGIVNKKTGAEHPRLNVVEELGRARATHPNKVILLLEEGVDLPSNDSAIVYERFTQENMEKAFVKVARELVAFGILKAVKPDA